MSYYRGESNETKDVFNMDIVLKKTFEDVNIYYNNDFTELRRREFYDLADEINAKEINKIGGSGAIATMDLVPAGYFASGAVTTAKIADGAVVSYKIKNEAFSTNQIGNIGAYAHNCLAHNVITADKIASNAIQQKGSGDINNIATTEITGDKFGSGCITEEKINSFYGILGSNCATGSITAEKLAANPSITAGDYTHATITTTRNGMITAISSGA